MGMVPPRSTLDTNGDCCILVDTLFRFTIMSILYTNGQAAHRSILDANGEDCIPVDALFKR